MNTRSSYANNKVLKSGIWYTISNFFMRGIGFLTAPIFTRLLTQAEFGELNNYLSWQSILTIFVTLNLESTFGSARYDHQDDFDEYVLSLLVLSSISVAVWFIVFLVFRDNVTNITGMSIGYVCSILLYLFFLVPVNLFQARERMYFRYKWSVLVSMILSVGTSFLSVLLVLVLSDRLFGRILGMIAPTVLLGACLYIWLCIKGKKIDPSYWRYALPICIPYIPHLLSLTVLNSMDRIMINRWCGDEAAGLYSLAYSCGAIVAILFTSINSAYGPWLAERLSAEDYKRIREVSRYYIAGGVSLAVGIMLLAPEVLLILGGTPYLEAKYVIPPVFTGCVCQFLYTMFVNVEQIKKKTVGMAFASISAAGLNYLLNWLLIPRFGYLVAAYTTLVGYMWLLLVHMFLVRRMGLSRIYDCGGILFLVAMLCIFITAVNVLYRFNVLRYLIFGLYLLLLFCAVHREQGKIRTLFRKDV